MVCGGIAERLKDAARRDSDLQLEIGRLLLEAERSGEWRAEHATFEAYVAAEFGLLPSAVQEHRRVQRKLSDLQVSPEQAAEIGWTKLKTVAPKLTAQTRDQLLAELRTETIQTLHAKYRARKSCSRQSTTARCEPQPPHCESPPLQRTTHPPSPNSTSVSAPSHRHVAVTELVARALRISRHHTQTFDDQENIDSICMLFILRMGTDEDRQWLTTWLHGTGAADNPPPTPIRRASRTTPSRAERRAKRKRERQRRGR